MSLATMNAIKHTGFISIRFPFIDNNALAVLKTYATHRWDT
jgi:hypothetical protein